MQLPSSERAICAVIPAAGKGSRLGLAVPKILAPLTPTLTVWDVLQSLLAPYVEHIHVILSPFAAAPFHAHLAQAGMDDSRLSHSIQREPLGMGDAVFSGVEYWQTFRDILVLWGDQVFVSEKTVQRTIALQSSAQPPSLTIPVCKQSVPYVDYVFDEKGRLERVHQAREGDVCRRNGISDVGLFMLSATTLADHWRSYGSAGRGSRTGELNFLPFLAHLSSVCQWNTAHFEVDDVRESRGINTPEDLTFYRQLLAKSDRRPRRDA